jgi:hypothetical protein
MYRKQAVSYQSSAESNKNTSSVENDMYIYQYLFTEVVEKKIPITLWPILYSTSPGVN